VSRKYLLDAARHRHEVGEDRSRCRTCQLEEKLEGFSPFESAAWNWYQRHFTPLVVETGLLGRLVDRLDLDPLSERIFLKALNEIRQMNLRIQIEDARK